MSSPFDPAAIYALLGQSVTHQPVSGSPVTGLAVFDQPGRLLFTDVIATDPGLRYETAVFPNVRCGDSFIVGVDTWVVREDPRALLDGQESTVALKRLP